MNFSWFGSLQKDDAEARLSVFVYLCLSVFIGVKKIGHPG